jgi:threonine/homoserine efflux transporter RhtA
MRTPRNFLALACGVAGVYWLMHAGLAHAALTHAPSAHAGAADLPLAQPALAYTGAAEAGDTTRAWISGAAPGFVFAFVNCALFVLYIMLGHKIARKGGPAGIDRLGMAMLVAMLAALPIGIWDAMPAFASPLLLAAAVGVGISSSVIPYVCDQLAMARLPRATFALLLALLPATATVIGVVVLRQVPSIVELAGVGLVILGVGIHRETR